MKEFTTTEAFGLIPEHPVKSRHRPIPFSDLGIITGYFSQYGKIGLEGRLGYDDDTVLVPEEFDDWSPISTHAVSEVVLELDHATEVFGILNASCNTIRDENPAVFSVNNNILGECYAPWEKTGHFVLPPEKHKLHVHCVGHNHHLHALWMCRKYEQPYANTKNTAFLTVAAYPKGRDEIRFFLNSAEIHNIRYVAFMKENRGMGFTSIKSRECEMSSIR